MISAGVNVPDFLLIGAQRSGTTWLWKFLDAHPGTDLPDTKEIHYYGGVENFRKGKKWYLDHFKDLSGSKVIGEASPTYLYDRMPYWGNSSNRIEFDGSLPPIPEIIKNDLPDTKILMILRDPVRRAVSGYRFWLNRLSRNGNLPLKGLMKLALEQPKLRILEFGHYPQHLKPWLEVCASGKIKIFIFEEDVVRQPARMLHDVYSFLGLDADFLPQGFDKRVHGSSSITRIFLTHYAAGLGSKFIVRGVGALSDRFDFLRKYAVSKRDIEFLRSVYLPQKEALESLLDRDLSCWDYGESLLNQK